MFDVQTANIFTPFHEQASSSLSANRRSPAWSQGRAVPRGLVNLGNTCYLNSAVQALAACRPLAEHLEWSLELIKLRTTHKQGQRLTEIFFRMLMDLRPRPSPSQPFAPKEMVAVARTLTPALEEIGRQQDAEEFLSALIHGVHEHTKRPLSERELTDLKARLTSRWRRCTGLEWRDEAQVPARRGARRSP